MLDKFEKIYNTNVKANDDDWSLLSDWLSETKFPQKVLPKEYVLLMSESNGGNYTVGEREYQFLSLKEIPEYYGVYLFEKYMPFAFPFAMDGCGNFYIFNPKEKDESVYIVSSGNLGWEKDECFFFANSFSNCVSDSGT